MDCGGLFFVPWRIGYDGGMLHDLQVLRRGDSVLLGIAVESAVLDIETNETALRNCVALLDAPHRGLIDCRLGQFGPFPVTFMLHADESVTIFIDGPPFEQHRTQSAGLYLSKDDARKVLATALGNSLEVPELD